MSDFRRRKLKGENREEFMKVFLLGDRDFEIMRICDKLRNLVEI